MKLQKAFSMSSCFVLKVDGLRGEGGREGERMKGQFGLTREMERDGLKKVERVVE